ncbi:hypothetical protein MMC20_005285 [Loxospora ochrophaea]|nr:hypothetical protein [Loxospora ochrophaea]
MPVDTASPPVPTVAPPASNLQESTSSSTTTSISSSLTSSDTEPAVSRTPRMGRPKLSSRKPSGSIIVPRDSANIEIEYEEFPPNDARAMSPRRNSVETERLGREARLAIQEHARSLQSGLNALAERIETVKSDHDKLERQNLALQDYIGGLTRSMSRTEISTSGKAKK